MINDNDEICMTATHFDMNGPDATRSETTGTIPVRPTDGHDPCPTVIRSDKLNGIIRS